MTVFGGGVAEAHVLVHVVTRKAGGAVSASMGHGERTVGVSGGDGPQVAVAHRLPTRRAQLSVVATSRNDVAGIGELASGDRDGNVGPELADGDTDPLHGVVDGVDVIVGSGGDRHGL